MYEGREDIIEVADMMAHVPRGGAVAEWVGGNVAITAETESLWELSYILAQVNSKKKVKPREMPEGLRVVERKRDHTLSMAEKFRAKEKLKAEG